MRKTILILFFFFFGLDGVLAQPHASRTSMEFHSFNQLGLLQGESVSAFHLQTVNGIQYNNWFTGIGVGLDYYRFKSIPLFIDLKKYIGKEKSQFFVYADGGVSFAWGKKENDFSYTSKHDPGFYCNTGLGYKAGLKNGMAVVLNAGYSYKRINEIQQQTICPFIGPCYMQTDKYSYDLNRLVLQIGWMF